MAKEFRLPDVGEGISEAEIVHWLVKEGDTVKEDQELVQIETDKALVTLPSPYAGKIAKLHGHEGDVLKVGDVLVTIEETDGKVAAPPEDRARRDRGTVVGALEEADDQMPPVQAIPAVRALARELKVDLATVRGTGPGGRITREDVEQAAGKAAAAPREERDAWGPVEKVALRGLRRTIAKHMTEAARRIAHVAIWEDADITDLQKVRAKERKVAEEKGIRLTYLPFVMKAVISALKAHPRINATLDDERGVIVLKKYYNIGIAVDTPDGLIVFVVKEADQKTILDLAREIGVLGDKARARTLQLAELKGSTFTITNYGVFGASYGTPIINYPEVAILGIGKIEDRPVVREGQIAIRKIMPLSLVFDHRVIDGGEAGQFLGVVIQHLEDPDLMLIGGK
ncbi:MAG TPA: dihydrolipoamide acetyltransferase family protein [Candidatus Acidoferrales bacterium]|nr:dihydrolipoamide acetyltransferase family protein [Candidatus Acidoferrales bacterium]